MGNKNETNKPDHLSPNQDLTIQELEQGLQGGLRFANLMSSMNQEDIKTCKTVLNSLVELLIQKGLIHLHELDERKETIMRSLMEKSDQSPRVHLVSAPDKYADQTDIGINCSERHDLCLAACCTFWFALAAQDLDERIVKWDYLRPYGIAQGEDGYCVHFDRQTFQCTIYEYRPLTCRTFSCRDDRRVWMSFEHEKQNPALTKLKP